MSKVTGLQVLDLAMDPKKNDANARSVRDYLRRMLVQVFDQEECFSGKRPFGNSGWMTELQVPLINAKYVDGKLDEDGCVETCDDLQFRTLMTKAIQAL